jgi:hypothetical protein
MSAGTRPARNRRKFRVLCGVVFVAADVQCSKTVDLFYKSCDRDIAAKLYQSLNT